MKMEGSALGIVLISLCCLLFPGGWAELVRPDSGASCTDRDHSCKTLALGYHCLRNPKTMRQNCPRACAIAGCRKVPASRRFLVGIGWTVF